MGRESGPAARRTPCGARSRSSPTRRSSTGSSSRRRTARGEILVAAMMRAFVDVWTRRLEALGTIDAEYLDRGASPRRARSSPTLLLTMAIRAIDYTPPIHIEFARLPQRAAHRRQRGPRRRQPLRAPRGPAQDWFARYGINAGLATDRRALEAVRAPARQRAACASAACRPTRSRCSGSSGPTASSSELDADRLHAGREPPALRPHLARRRASAARDRRRVHPVREAAAPRELRPVRPEQAAGDAGRPARSRSRAAAR